MGAAVSGLPASEQGAGDEYTPRRYATPPAPRAQNIPNRDGSPSYAVLRARRMRSRPVVTHALTSRARRDRASFLPLQPTPSWVASHASVDGLLIIGPPDGCAQAMNLGAKHQARRALNRAALSHVRPRTGHAQVSDAHPARHPLPGITGYRARRSDDTSRRRSPGRGGPHQFPSSPSERSAPHTPRSPSRLRSRLFTASMAFTLKDGARLSLIPLTRALSRRGRLRLTLRTARSLPLKGS